MSKAPKKGHKTLLEIRKDGMGNAYVSKASKGIHGVTLQKGRGARGALRIDITGTDITPGYRRISSKASYTGPKPRKASKYAGYDKEDMRLVRNAQARALRASKKLPPRD